MIIAIWIVGLAATYSMFVGVAFSIFYGLTEFDQANLISIEDCQGVDKIKLITKYGGSVDIETDEQNSYDGDSQELLGRTHEEMIHDLSSPRRSNDYIEWDYEQTEKGLRWGAVGGEPVMKNTSGITATAAEGIGGVELDIEMNGDAYDGGGPLVCATLKLDLGLESAYALAMEIVNAANARRESEIQRVLHDREKWGLNETRTVQEIEATIARLPGPFVVGKARKLTEEEKAARAAAPKEG